MKPVQKKSQRNTHHKDGSVSFWDVYSQTWRRLEVDDIPEKNLMTMNRPELNRIMKMRLAMATKRYEEAKKSGRIE